MKRGLKWFDEKLIKLINNKMQSKFLDGLMPKLTNIGGGGFISLATLMFFLFKEEKLRKIGIHGALTLALSQSAVYGLKSLLGRERPYNILKTLNTFGIDLKDYSFPSGHTSSSFSLATAIALNIPRLAIYLFFIAFLVGISRIYLGVHYPSDVVAGMFLGIGSAILVHLHLLNYIEGLIFSFRT